MSTALDPTTNAARQADARREKAGTPEEDQALDPAFPYQVIRFDPTVFGRVADKESGTPA
ncbi:MAG: hypothetical protein NTZ46_10015 [Verrucomicrobia bacterium]|nr:hypothetical protein [Verrucomicrobiota bacterium]